MKKKLLLFAATVASLICILCLTASAAEIASGTCGKNLTWSLDDKGLLTISGTADMDNWTMTSKVPWNKNKTAIKEAVIENGVTSIGYNAFQGCSSLTKVTLPESLTAINNSAFYKCTSLETIALPSKLENINGSAFYGCSSIKSINIPASLSTLGSNALANCFALESITVDAENAQYSSFEGVLFNKDMSELLLYPPAKPGATYNFPASVKKIAAYAFSDCSKLESVRIPDSVKSITHYTFEASTSLKSVYIPTSVISIGNNVFYNCTNLKTITYAGRENGWNMITKGENWNKNAPSFRLVYENQFFILASGKCGDALTFTVDSERTLTISGTGEMYDYEAGGAPWYEYGDYVRALTVKDGVTSIGSYAFYKYSALTIVSMGKTLFAIGNSAFEHCALLPSVTIPGTVTEIGAWAYANCQTITEITVPESVKSIGYGAFSAIWPLESINVDANNAFYSSVDGVLFNKDKTELILCPMNNPRTKYGIPAGVKSIADLAFYNCKLLNEISIPKSVTSIGAQAFAYCVNLSKINFGGSEFEWNIMTRSASWNHGAVSGMPEISYTKDENMLASGKCGESAYWRLGTDGVLTIAGSGAMYDYCSSMPGWYELKNKITSAVIADGISTVGEGAFMDCSLLVGVDIPKSVWLIEDAAFFGCTSLKEIAIPSAVQRIGSHAFYNCTALETIAYAKTEAEWKKLEKGTDWDHSAGAETANGKYTLVCAPDTLWGDANGDGTVDNKDLVRIKKYLAGLDYDTGISTEEVGAGADANGDGDIDNKDLVRLKKYLAAYDWDTGTSDVILGPEPPKDPDGLGWSDFFPC